MRAKLFSIVSAFTFITTSRETRLPLTASEWRGRVISIKSLITCRMIWPMIKRHSRKIGPKLSMTNPAV